MCIRDRPEVLRVDIDDLLAKAEQFYRTNIETLKFADTGQNKSFLDKYKMEKMCIRDRLAFGNSSGQEVESAPHCLPATRGHHSSYLTRQDTDCFGY